ncbi:MAG: succinylglutamate desuccinylase/aspartoacylase family protein [Nitrospinae bacterium]|nr:succinylglutamate desuccinylase/aspartoacylase family protein [Nitrospinota bacterium]MBL7021629.1 succinylglutamate desuccinylase/aspartoacylase family protein [Nitrospinaceae bacterium]
MKEKVLSIPTAFGAPLELYKNTWGKSGETLSIVSGLQGDHLNGMYLNSRLSLFLDSVVEGIDPNYTLKGRVVSFPVANLNAIQSGSKLWPYDGMDMDLAFPGNPQGETTEALASAIYTHTADSYWGLILQSAPPHYEDAPHIQTIKLDGRIKKLCRDLKIETARKLNVSTKVNLLHHWHARDITAITLSAGSPRTLNRPQCETLFHGIVNFMVVEKVLKDNRKIKPEEKTNSQFYEKNDDVAILASTAGMFLKEAKVGTPVQTGQKIGEIRDIYSGKRLEEITATAEGFLVTLRQYPIVYEKEPIATILTAKKSWREYLPWS